MAKNAKISRKFTKYYKFKWGRGQAFCKKYAELSEEVKVGQANFKALERKVRLAEREREQLQAENSKGVLARSRLEELCRELQRQNKAVKEESVQRIREEEERRKEVASKFQSTLAEVSTLLQQNNEKNTKLREENSEMAAKLQLLCDQYTLREQHLEKLAKQVSHRSLAGLFWRPFEYGLLYRPIFVWPS